MNLIEIPEKNISVNFPSQLDELNQNQFILFVELLLDCIAGKISLQQFKYRLTVSFLNIKMDRKYFRLSKEDQENVLGEVYRLSDLIDSFFDEEQREGRPVKVFKLDFIHNFIPKLCGNLYGPADALTDITFCEYRIAHQYFNAYLKSTDENDLNHLIAVLYRPKKRFLSILKHLPGYDGQMRVPFSSKSNPLFLKKRVRKISNLPFPVRYGIYLFFSGCEDFLAKGVPEVDGIPIDLSVLYEKGEGFETSQGTGLYGVLCTLAESKVFGSMLETDTQNLYDILLRLFQVVTQMKKTLKPDGTH